MAFREPTKIVAAALRALKETRDAKGAEAVWREYLGRQGLLRQQLRHIGSLPSAGRARKGKALHQAIARVEAASQARLETLRREEEEHVLRHERLDVTIAAPQVHRGTLHPLTLVRREAERIFSSMGFSVASGPEVEDAWHNFDALNIPDDHPARDLWNTFWVKSKTSNPRLRQGSGGQAKSKLLLRTHTSPVQIRYMETHQPPFRIIAPGQVYRYEASDASHNMQFWQIEGLMVDRRNTFSPVTLETLLSVLTSFFEQFFRKTVALRVRPSYFPFTEPSIEVDLSCIICGGSGKLADSPCGVCKESGWLEMGGAGMVHPKVFEALKFHSKEVQGFAFGFGIDRLAMLKYRIPDIRLFRQGDLRFLSQFK